MKYIYILLVIVIFIQVFRRRFDFLSFSAITYCFYSINCAFGKTWITGGSTGMYYNTEISYATYCAVFIQMMIIIWVLIADRKNIKFVSTRRNNSKSPDLIISSMDRVDGNHKEFWIAIIVFSYAVTIYNIVFRMGLAAVFSYTSKTALQENVSALWGFAVWGTVLVFLYSVRYEYKGLLLASVLLLLVPFFLGSRAYVATAIVGAIAIKSGNIRNIAKQNIKIIILGIIAIVFLSMYKKIYMAFRALDFGMVISSLKKGITLPRLDDIVEFRTVFSLYNYVVDTNFKLPMLDSLARVLSIIPLANNYIPTIYNIRLSTIIETQFIRASYGLGGTFWGETIAMGGIVSLIIVTLTWLLLLRRANRFIEGKSDSAIFTLSVASYCAFYIHRLDWVQVMGCFKSVIVFYIIYRLISFLHIRIRIRNN